MWSFEHKVRFLIHNVLRPRAMWVGVPMRTYKHSDHYQIYSNLPRDYGCLLSLYTCMYIFYTMCCLPDNFFLVYTVAWEKKTTTFLTVGTDMWIKWLLNHVCLKFLTFQSSNEVPELNKYWVYLFGIKFSPLKAIIQIQVLANDRAHGHWTTHSDILR